MGFPGVTQAWRAGYEGERSKPQWRRLWRGRVRAFSFSQPGLAKVPREAHRACRARAKDVQEESQPTRSPPANPPPPRRAGALSDARLLH